VTIRHFIILGLALCIILVVIGIMPLVDIEKPTLRPKDLSDTHNDKTLDPTRTVPGEPARHWEITPVRRLKGTIIY